MTPDKPIPAVVIANQKGGVGKTTTTVNLAGALAQREKKILVADFDPQGSATKSLTDEHPQNTILDVFEGKEITPLKTRNPLIDLLPADSSLSSVIPKMSADYDLIFKLKDYLSTLTGYNVIFCDTPPTLMNLSLAGMVAARYMLVPISTQYFSLQGTNDLLASFQKVKRLNPDIQLLGACISCHDKRTALANELLSEIKAQFNGNFFETIIPRTIKIEEAQVQCKTVNDLFPGSDIAKQYLSLADEILRRLA